MSFAQALVKTLKPDPYGEAGVERIIARRRERSLGVDRLLGPANAAKYPPRGPDEAIGLIAKIEGSLGSRAAVARAIYYLLLDYPLGATNNESVAAYYASETKLSGAQTEFVRGLWHLDHGELEEALACLCEPWEAEIGDGGEYDSFAMSILRDSPRLLIAFVTAKQPALDADGLDAYVDALASEGLTFEVLKLSREEGNLDVLRRLGQYAARAPSRSVALAVAQLPCAPDEWQVIQAELDAAIEQDPNGLAGELTMVRALHVGDLPAISRMKQVTERYQMVAKGTAEL